MRTTNPKEKTMSELIERAKSAAAEASAALKRRDALGSAECSELIIKANQAHAEVGARFQAIKPAQGERSAGAARARVLREGSAEEIAALNDEFRIVEALREQLGAQLEALRLRRQAAISEEAVAGMPAALAALEKATAESERLAAQLKASLEELDAQFLDVMQKRGVANAASLSVHGASPELCRRIEGLRVWAGATRYHVFQVELADRLGAEPEESIAA